MERTQQPSAQPLGPSQENAQTQSLTALGLRATFSRFPIPRVIGPFNYFDARASLTQSIFNFKDIEKERAASASLKSAQYSYKDARELVVLAVGNAYLQAIATAARIETTEAQVTECPGLIQQSRRPAKSRAEPCHRYLALSSRVANPPAATDRRAQRLCQTETVVGASHRSASGAGVRPHRKSPLSGADSIAG